MEQIPLQCGRCGHGFTRAAAGSSRVAHCPVCDAEVPLPRPEEAGEGGGRLRLLRHGTVGGQAVLCPSCRASMAPDDRACGNCGALRVPGAGDEKQPSAPAPDVKPVAPPPPAPRRRSRRRIPFFWILVAAAGVYGWWLRSPPKPGPAHPPSREALTPDERLSEARERVHREWDSTRPLAEQGDDVELEHRTGRVIRGRLVQRIDDRAVDVLTGQGREIVAYEDLRSSSRSVVDPDYRARRIEEQTRRAAGLP